jgi:ABC-2 type transport system permease protein
VSPALHHAAGLARRSLIGIRREPVAWFPTLFFPLLLMAIFTGSFGETPGRIPGFPPIRGFLDFAVAGSVLQAALLIGTVAGTALARDIEGGFFDRLVLSPVSRTAILAGHLAGAVVLAVALGALFIGVAVAFGARVDGGIVGVLLVLLIAAVMAMGMGGLGLFLALRTGSSEAVQGAFPLFFMFLFFSSAYFPRETMSGWFREVADLNPISHLVEGMRAEIVEGDLTGSAGLGLLVGVGLAALTLGASGLALRRRLGGGE